MKEYTILIGADFVPTETNVKLFSSGNVEEILGKELKKLISECDYKIFNLEMPLVDDGVPIEKSGPSLRAPVNAVKLYKELSIDLLELANNHINDYGEHGIKSTISALDEAGISWTGVGETIKDAVKPFFFQLSGKKYGIVSCVEHEFSIAGDDSWGANPFNPLEIYDEVISAKRNCDYLIVLYHGGREHFRYPSPELQNRCRKFIDKGANIVICQHSHCIGCEEKYNKGTIIYGQGNFLFDLSDEECWRTGILVGIKNDNTVEYIPVLKNGNSVRLADVKEKTEILNDFYVRSSNLKQDGYVKRHFNEEVERWIDGYLCALAGINRNSKLFIVLNKLTNKKFSHFLVKMRYSKKRMMTIQNYLNCESHFEVIRAGIESMNCKAVK